MNIIPILLKEMAQEAATTRKMLALVPEDKYDWKPHIKSMSLRQLAGHIAELPGWVAMTLTTSELDFAAGQYNPPVFANNKELLAVFEEQLKNGSALLEKATEDQLNEKWTLRTGDKIHGVFTKLEVVRMAFSQIIHHRAQLGMDLRLLDIAIPGSYGPSANDMSM